MADEIVTSRRICFAGVGGFGPEYPQPVVRIQAISDQQNIPKRFLEQILNELKSAGVVESKRGSRAAIASRGLRRK